MHALLRLRRVIIALASLAHCWQLPKCDGFASSDVQTPHHRSKEVVPRTLSQLAESSCLALVILTSTCTDARAVTIPGETTTSTETQSTTLSWQLPNGLVELSNPLTSFSKYKLTNPTLLGAGGGGAVFATHPMKDVDGAKNTNNNNDVAVKISWARSASSVKHECEILQELEIKHTRNMERCLGVESYPPDPKRTMIALQPVVENAVSRIDKINPDAQPLAVQAIVQTFLDMLHANVITTDVQTLIDKETGKVLFIDMTEAQTMSTPTPTYLDLALASSFISEIVALIPTSLMDTAANTFMDELSALHAREEYLPMPIYELLREQEVLLTPKSTEMIDNTIAILQ